MKKDFIITLTLKQLIHLGVHLGHLRKNSLFLTAWMFYGWRKEIFIINMIKTFMAAKICSRYVSRVITLKRTIWYVTQNKVLSPLLCRYAVISGECFNVYYWIPGSLSNIKKVVGWHFLLVRLLKTRKYIFRHQDKKKFMSFIGFLLKFKRIPGCGYLPIVFESLTALDEFASTIIPSISITDSNFNSIDVMIPLAGNDESMVCLNFFTYFVTRIIFVSKIKQLLRWKIKIRKKARVNRALNLKYKYMYLAYFKHNLHTKNKAKEVGKHYFDKRFDNYFNNVTKSIFKSTNLNLRNHILHQAFIENETVLSLIHKDKILLDSTWSYFKL